MTVAAYRARKRLIAHRSANESEKSADWHEAMLYAISVLDQELERVAEQEFLRPMNPDPLKGVAEELRKR